METRITFSSQGAPYLMGTKTMLKLETENKICCKLI